MIDTHCHLNVDPLYPHWQQHVEEAVSAGVTYLLVLGTDPDTNRKALKIASHPSVSPAIGLHPELVTDLVAQNVRQAEIQLDQYQQILSHQFKQNQDQIAAIGEIGIDYFQLEKNVDLIKRLQQQLFSFQLELANQHQLPVSVHIRDAHADAIKLLSIYRPRGVLHCFSGDYRYLQQALALGLFISYAGNVTFKNAPELQKLAEATPLDHLLLETDSPYLNPYRGQFPNTPKNITKTYQFIADLKHISLQDLDQQLSQNASELFGLKL